MGAYVTILAPDGTAGKVPAENASAALAAGGKLGIHVYAPDGTAGFVPHDQLPAALKAGASAAPHSQTASDEPHGFMQSMVAPIPQLAKGLYHSVVDDPQNPQEQAAMGTTPDSGMIARALGHVGLAGYRNLVAPAIQHSAEANASVSAGHPLQALSEAAEGIPLIGGGVTAGKQALAQYANGDTKGALGSVAGNVLTAGMAGGLAAGPEASGVAAITPEEIASRQVAKAVNPPAPAYQQYLEAVRNQLGNVLDYAKRNGISIQGAGNKNVGPSLAKVAGMAKDETAAHYEGNVLGPHQEVRPGGVTQGRLANTDPTLRQIDSRITDIADEQRSANRQPTPGQVAGMSDAELTAEKAHLSSILHESLGNLTGMGAEDVQGLRQRMAQLSVLAGETEGAANAVTRGAGIREVGAGSNLPTVSSTHGLLAHLMSAIPGFDPETLQGKAIVKAISNIPETSTMRNGNALPATFDGARQEAIATTAKNMVSKHLQAQATRKELLGMSRFLNAPDIGGGR